MTFFTGQLGSENSQLGHIQLGVGEVQLPETASNTLTISQSVTVLHLRPASNIFVPSQSVVVHYTPHNEAVVQSLTFSQLARGFNGTKTIVAPITFTQVASSRGSYVRSASNALSFVQAADVVHIRPASNVITFSQSATVNVYKGTFSTLALTQTVVSNYTPHNDSAPQTFTIHQTAIPNQVFNRSVSNTITFSGAASGHKVFNLSVTSPIAFNSTTVTDNLLRPNSTLSITQTVTGHKIVTQSVHHTLGLQQALSRQMIYALSASNTLVFGNTHLARGANGYYMQVPNLIVTIPAQYVVYQVPGQAVTFKPPLFGDTEGGKDKLIQQRTVTGGLYTYVRRSASRLLVYKFDITSAKAEEFRGYIQTNLSNPMELTNWKGEIWYGYIVNNPFVTTSKGRRAPLDGEEFEIEVQFEGVQVH